MDCHAEANCIIFKKTLIMLKISIKNLLRQGTRNLWIFLELVIVTLAMWIIMEPLIVGHADRNLSLGFDADRLAVLTVHSLTPGSEGYVQQADSMGFENFNRLMMKVRSLPEVEYATPVMEMEYPGSYFTSMMMFGPGVPGDSLLRYLTYLPYYPGQDYFETMGFKSIDAGLDTETLSAEPVSQSGTELVVTRTIAELLWPGKKIIGLEYEDRWQGPQRIKGVIEDWRHNPYLPSSAAALIPMTMDEPMNDFSCVLRLKSGVDMGKFVDSLNERAEAEINTGNYFLSTSGTLRDAITENGEVNGVLNSIRMKTALAVFLMLNIFLGVSATFYFATRRRVTEIGVHRSLGATAGKIIRMLMTESVVLGLMSFVIGELILFNFIDSVFSSSMSRMRDALPMQDVWTTNFWPWFAVVSATVCVLLLICVAVGTYIPARNISKINPVDALRHE